MTECPCCHADYCRCVVPSFVGTKATRDDLVAALQRAWSDGDTGDIPDSLVREVRYREALHKLRGDLERLQDRVTFSGREVVARKMFATIDRTLNSGGQFGGLPEDYDMDAEAVGRAVLWINDTPDGYCANGDAPAHGFVYWPEVGRQTIQVSFEAPNRTAVRVSFDPETGEVTTSDISEHQR